MKWADLTSRGSTRFAGARCHTSMPRPQRRLFAALHHAIDAGLVRACHDLSEGGLAVAAAEMAFAGGWGAKIDLGSVPCDEDACDTAVLLFSESNTRFLCEIRPENAAAWETAMNGIPHGRIGEVTHTKTLLMTAASTVIDADLKTLKEAWQNPLRW